MDAGATPRSAGLGGGFGRLWAASAISNLGDGLLLAAVPLLVASLTTDPLLVAGATAAGQLPWLLLALPAGAWVDRWDRRRVLLVADGIRAVVVLGLAWAAAGGGPAGAALVAIYGVAFVLAAAETFFDPASEALVARIVAPAALGRANGRLQGTTWLANIFAGPALGALLYGLAPWLPFVADAVTFVLAVLLVATLRGSFRPVGGASGGRPSLRGEIAEGLRWLARQPTLRTLAIAAGLVNLASFAIIATFVLYARVVLGISGTEYGILLSVIGVGGLIGATLAPPVLARLGPGNAIRIGLMLGAGAGVALAVTTDVAVVVVGGLGFGIMLTFWNVAVITLRQRMVPDHLRGRVMSAYRLVAWGTQPIGAVLGGALAGAVSLSAVPAVAAAIYVLVALGTTRIRLGSPPIQPAN